MNLGRRQRVATGKGLGSAAIEMTPAGLTSSRQGGDSGDGDRTGRHGLDRSVRCLVAWNDDAAMEKDGTMVIENDGIRMGQR
ncbi:hypothetical protein M0R45_001152 [Rubus argutus]|uniref:Uncharacterized protein n=1 Tax=Rubus argutus TaxID=59490 RepID=A0AAW1VLC1_RUBAR